MGAREFFEAHAGDAQKCKALQQQSQEELLSWECEVAAAASPGPVGNDETVTRYWLNPVHFDTETGALKPTAFEDAANKGLSVNRLSHISLQQIAAMASERALEWNRENPEGRSRELIGYSDFTAGELRAVVTAEPDQLRAFAVYDTAKVDDVSHADVCQIVSSKKDGRSARSQLRDLANERLRFF